MHDTKRYRAFTDQEAMRERQQPGEDRQSEDALAPALLAREGYFVIVWTYDYAQQ
jgi:hypothetical protein